MKTKLIIAGVALILVVSTTLKLKSNKRVVEGNVYHPDTTRSVLVNASKVEARSFDKTFSYTGTFAANREVMLIPQTHGQVTGIHFSEGDAVREGQLLVQIDDDLLQAQLASAEVNYQTARRSLERNEKASVTGGVSGIQLDNLRMTLKQAESTVKQLKKQIALSRIDAPFAGTITFRDVELGSVVGNSPVARLTDLTQLKLEISVPEKEVVLFKEGESAEVTTDIYPGKSFRGQILYVADRGDNAHNYQVKIVVKNGGLSLKAGMYGTAGINKISGGPSLLIPRTALLGSAKNPQVFTADNGVAKLINIQIGRSNNDAVEVLHGLKAGQVVVTSGHINLAHGSNIQVANRPM